ncbi:LOW QUALITY PROTEIN: major histocompatibility complex class I-related gene protein [Delphinus delphis]|uniref:LOW QUALITY PROTEIN: major histocompatibility complex class I-related gene protein n=1 Tax=Delphinus delphis TaxID=9728 RepID=UPI0028C4FCAC|nr:LOW QUALITY PROTEIN: major histocompatibility complex class I-related gene protein [Delphinus delphis]
MVLLLPLIIALAVMHSDARFHPYQRMIGCELLEDGNTTGFLQYAYDGQDFIIFGKDTLSWIAMGNVAHITKRAWEASQHELQYQKNWLEEECIAWLKRFLEYGKGTLQRTEPPLVRVVHMVLQGSQESETMLLVMKAVGFIVPTTVLSGVGVVAWQRKP